MKPKEKPIIANDGSKWKATPNTPKVETLFYVRLIRLKQKNSPNKGYQIEKICVIKNEVVKTELLWKPNTLEQVMALSNEALDPEKVV